MLCRTCRVMRQVKSVVLTTQPTTEADERREVAWITDHTTPARWRVKGGGQFSVGSGSTAPGVVNRTTTLLTRGTSVGSYNESKIWRFSGDVHPASSHRDQKHTEGSSGAMSRLRRYLQS